MTATERQTLLEKGVGSLLTHGFGIIPFPLYPGILNGISQDLLRFCAEPPEFKLRFAIDRELGEDADNGYLMREGKLKPDGITRDDEKEMFHFRPFLPLHLGRKGIAVDGYGRFFDKCDALWRICEETHHTIARIIDRSYPGWNCAQLVRHPVAGGKHVVRLVAYTDTFEKQKEIIAKPHTDKSFVTIHVCESYAGLRLWLPNGVKVPHRTAPGTALIFFGDFAGRVTRAVWPAMRHDVEDIRLNTNQWQPPRWSMIFFGHIAA